MQKTFKNKENRYTSADNAFFFCVNNKKVLSLSFSPAAWHNENRKDIHDITSQCVSVSFNVTCAVKKKRRKEINEYDTELFLTTTD